MIVTVHGLCVPELTQAAAISAALIPSTAADMIPPA
jgi:hypothetical protein